MTNVVCAGSASRVGSNRANAEILMSALCAGLEVELGDVTVMMIDDALFHRVTLVSGIRRSERWLPLELPVNWLLRAAAAMTEEQRFGLVSQLALRAVHKVAPPTFVEADSKPVPAVEPPNRQTATVDGSCVGNPGRGGWAVVLDDGQEFSGSIDGQTTNNRAEITAAIEAVRHARPSIPLVIRTDSEYVVRTINGEFARRSNLDLWEVLFRAIAAHKAPVSAEWVRGHAGHPENECADRLARAAASRR